MTENSHRNDFPVNNSEKLPPGSLYENRQENIKAAYEKMFKEAIENGNIDDIYFEERQKIEDISEKAAKGKTETDIDILKESFIKAHNSKESLNVLEKKYSNLMNLAAECGTIKELYENELNKIAVIAKHLPADVYNAKKEILEKAYLNAYTETSSGRIINLKNSIIATIFIIFSLFAYVKTKQYIDFHTLSAKEKAIIEERRKSVYNNKAHNPDADFQNHLRLREKAGRDMKQSQSYANKRNIDTLKNQLEQSEREARAAEAMKKFLMDQAAKKKKDSQTQRIK